MALSLSRPGFAASQGPQLLMTGHSRTLAGCLLAELAALSDCRDSPREQANPLPTRPSLLHFWSFFICLPPACLRYPSPLVARAPISLSSFGRSSPSSPPLMRVLFAASLVSFIGRPASRRSPTLHRSFLSSSSSTLCPPPPLPLRSVYFKQAALDPPPPTPALLIHPLTHPLTSQQASSPISRPSLDHSGPLTPTTRATLGAATQAAMALPASHRAERSGMHAIGGASF